MAVIQSIVIAPGDARATEVSDQGVVAVPLRAARRYDALAEGLGGRAGVPATVADGAAPAPGAGTVVVCRPDVLEALETARSPDLAWVVALDLYRGSVVADAERLALAAAVEARDYLDWMQSSSRPAAIVGRRELAARIGAEIDPGPLYDGPRYARLVRAEGGLPALLGDYLAAYAAAYLAGG